MQREMNLQSTGIDSLLELQSSRKGLTTATANEFVHVDTEVTSQNWINRP